MLQKSAKNLYFIDIQNYKEHCLMCEMIITHATYSRGNSRGNSRGKLTGIPAKSSLM